jgi:hypothetical protein
VEWQIDDFGKWRGHNLFGVRVDTRPTASELSFASFLQEEFTNAFFAEVAD